MIDLWKPAAVVAYCNQVRSGSTLSDSGPFGLHVPLTEPRTWSQIAEHNNRWAVECDLTVTGGSIPFAPANYADGFMLTAWICPDQIKDAPFCGVRTAGNTGFMVRTTANGVLNVVRYGTGSGQISTPGVFVAGQWAHIAVSMAPTSMKLYINGAQRGPASAAALPIQGVSTIGILGLQNYYQGADGTVGGGLIGKLADLCIWPRLLSDAEISWLSRTRNNILANQAPGLPLSRMVN